MYLCSDSSLLIAAKPHNLLCMFGGIARPTAGVQERECGEVDWIEPRDRLEVGALQRASSSVTQIEQSAE